MESSSLQSLIEKDLAPRIANTMQAWEAYQVPKLKENHQRRGQRGNQPAWRQVSRIALENRKTFPWRAKQVTQEAYIMNARPLFDTGKTYREIGVHDKIENTGSSSIFIASDTPQARVLELGGTSVITRANPKYVQEIGKTIQVDPRPTYFATAGDINELNRIAKRELNS